LAAGAPEHGAQALVDEILADEGGEDADGLGLVLGVEGEVRVFPVAEDAEALELFALDADEMAGGGLGIFRGS